MEYGVTWTDFRDDGINSQIYFTRINSIGDKIGSDIQIPNDFAVYPSLIWTGNELGVVWVDWRNGQTEEIYFAR